MKRCLYSKSTRVSIDILLDEQPWPVPREMTIEDIKTCVEQFRQGALNVMEAGFDGVEVGMLRGAMLELIYGASGGHVDDGLCMMESRMATVWPPACPLLVESYKVLRQPWFSLSSSDEVAAPKQGRRVHVVVGGSVCEQRL